MAKLQQQQVTTTKTIEKVTIARHCNFRPPDVASVVLNFNCEAHDALA